MTAAVLPSRRRQDWPEQLDAVVRAALGRRFRYGEHDCASFAAACVQAITGRDLFARHRGEYRDHDGACAYTFRQGGLAAAVTRALQVDPRGPEQAGRGDVVLIATPAGAALGICLGRQLAFATRPRGLAYRAREAALLSWEV